MKLSAGMVASLKAVTSLPDVVEVVVVPEVTTSLPAFDLSVAWCLIVQVTDGVEEPNNTALISVIVIARLVKAMVISSDELGFSIVIEYPLTAEVPAAPVSP
jgi:hypothetical protein